MEKIRGELFFKHKDKYVKGERYSINLFGWEVGDGWLRPIDEFLSSLTTPDPQITQIKEKYGHLRIYGTFNEHDIALLDMCEEKTSCTCEDCGEHGKTTSNNGWISTLCDDCRENRRPKRNIQL